jgi:hypothetical protein
MSNDLNDWTNLQGLWRERSDERETLEHFRTLAAREKKRLHYEIAAEAAITWNTIITSTLPAIAQSIITVAIGEECHVHNLGLGAFNELGIDVQAHHYALIQRRAIKVFMLW